VLVISAIDGSALGKVLAEAKAKSVPVVAYDLLIMGTDAVSYYATFGNTQVAVEQGLAIEKALNLKTAGGPFNIEFFSGDPLSDANWLFYKPAFGILQPYLDSGKLVCRSGQTEFMQVATAGWKTELATARMENLIATNNYGSGKTPLHAVLCSNDSVAQGVTAALLGAGYAAGPDFPIITGQDCDKVSVKNMIAGTQYMSVFRDTRILAARVKTMVEQILSGQNVDTNTVYNNAVKEVPSFDCELLRVTKDNYKEILIDSGYYTEADLQ
jgi:putative multiple sugar transport system substrate-binding protein